MVAVRDASVVMDEFEIKIPTASWRRACFEPVHSATREKHRRQARRAAKAFLRTTVGNINSGRIDIDGHPTERRHTVSDDQRAGFVSGGADCVPGLQSSRRGFRVNVSDHLRLSRRMNSVASSVANVLPQGFSKRTTWAPWRFPISLMRSQK
jgi:hypothetical protein